MNPFEEAETRKAIREKLKGVKRPKEGNTKKAKQSASMPQQIVVVLWFIFFAVILLCFVVSNM